MKGYGLEKQLGEVKASSYGLEKEHDTLSVTVQLVCDDLKLASE